MATSGSITYTQNLTSIIEDAFDRLGILADGESLTTPQRDKALRALNAMIQTWASDGVHLWKYREATLFLEKNVQSYLLGNSQANATESFVETTLTNDEAKGDTVLEVGSTTGITANDYVGVVLDDNTLFWDTVASVVAGVSITLNTGLPSVASSGNTVYTYTTKITKPLKITQARFLSSNTSEIECFEFNRDDYFRLANKATTGATTQFYYNPLREDTKLYVWPVAESPKLFKFTYYPGFEIFTTALDEPDIPTEWYECLVYNLAERLSTSYGFGENNPVYQTISRKAFEFYTKMSGFDSDDGIIRIMSTDNTGISRDVY